MPGIFGGQYGGLPKASAAFVTGEQIPRAQQRDQMELQNLLMQQQFQAQMQPLQLQLLQRQVEQGPERFGKIDPKDYTPESIQAFARSGNHAQLVPVRKPEAVQTTGLTGEPVTQFVDPYKQGGNIFPQPVKREMVNTGPSIQPVNPYTQNSPIGLGFSPSDRARLGLEGQRMWWETGVTPTIPGINVPPPPGRPGGAGAPPSAPPAPIVPPKDVGKATSDLRKEFNDLPEVKNYRAVVPMRRSMENAPDTAAGDLDMIYAVGKSLDPNSVVREGELALVIKAGSPAQRFSGWVNNVMGGGRLSAGQRQELKDMLSNRVGELKVSYDQALGTYSQVARRQGLPGEQIFQDVPELPAATGGGNRAAPAVGATQGGYRFKGGDPSKRENWEKI